MKKTILIFAGLMVSFFLGFGQTELRKPAVEITIDGKVYANGSEIKVQKGQVLELKANQQGGRRDFVKFPDNYLKVTPSLNVLSRSDNRLIYTENGTRTEWRLLSENVLFESDKNLIITKIYDQPNVVRVRVGTDSFARTFVRINVDTEWQFTSGIDKSTEKNDAEAYVYLSVDGERPWFTSKNIQVEGTPSAMIEMKLKQIQSNFDSIEYRLTKMNYPAVQAEIRKFQANVNSLNSTIQEEKIKSVAFQIKISLTGLPSDQPMQQLDLMQSIASAWNKAGNMITQQTHQLEACAGNPRSESVLGMIGGYINWQNELPESWIQVFNTYLPDLSPEVIMMTPSLSRYAEEGKIPQMNPCLAQLGEFYQQRSENIPIESQRITQVKNRLQAVKLFDGMLRSYISSINWAGWENSRSAGFALNQIN